MSRFSKRVAALAAVTVAVPLVMVASAGTSSAASTITWGSNGKCLGYGINEIDTNIASTTAIYMEACSAPGWTSVSWVDTQVSSGIWQEKPDVNTGYCLTANSNGAVYFAVCANSSSQHWREIHSGSNWYLQNVASSQYLTTRNNSQVVTGPDKLAWH